VPALRVIPYQASQGGIPMARAEAVRDGLGPVGGPVTFIAVEGASHASNVTHPDEVNRGHTGILERAERRVER